MVEQFQQHLAGISNQNDYYSKVASLSRYLLPTRKKNHTYLIHNIPDVYWRNTLTYSIYLKVDIYGLVKRLASSFG